MFTTANYQGETFTQEEKELCNQAVKILIERDGYSKEQAEDLVTNRFTNNATLEQLTKK